MKKIDKEDIESELSEGYFQELFSKPALLSFSIVLLIFWAEIVVMIIISYVSPKSMMLEAIVDAILLSLLISPVLFFVLFKPMKTYYSNHNQMKKELKDLKAELKILKSKVNS